MPISTSCSIPNSGGTCRSGTRSRASSSRMPLSGTTSTGWPGGLQTSGPIDHDLQHVSPSFRFRFTDHPVPRSRGLRHETYRHQCQRPDDHLNRRRRLTQTPTRRIHCANSTRSQVHATVRLAAEADRRGGRQFL
jgi:hypothetical protein